MRLQAVLIYYRAFVNGAKGLPFESHQCLCMYVEEISSVAMLAAKRLADVTPEVNLGEYVTTMPRPSANKAAPRGDNTSSVKQGYQGPTKRT